MTRALDWLRVILWGLFTGNLAGAAIAGLASYAGSPTDQALPWFIGGFAIALVMLALVEWVDGHA